MTDDPAPRPRWITITALTVAGSIGVYVFVVGSEIGQMKQKIDNHTLRIAGLESHGSGPVQATAEKVNGLTSRADRILTELLAMQQRIADLSATQQSQGVMLSRMQQDIAKDRTPP